MRAAPGVFDYTPIDNRASTLVPRLANGTAVPAVDDNEGEARSLQFRRLERHIGDKNEGAKRHELVIFGKILSQGIFFESTHRPTHLWL